jgi:hypothetical protein
MPAAIWKTLTSPGPPTLAICFAAYSLVYISVAVFLPTFLIERQGYAPDAAAYWAALAMAVVGLGAFSTVQQQRVVQLQGEVDVVTAEAEGVRRDLVGLSDMVADSVAMTALTPAQPVSETESPDAASAGTKSSKEQDSRYHSKRARGILITRPDGQSLLVVRGLRALEPGFIYRAWWWDEEHQTKSAAVFTVNENGYAWVRLHGHVDGMRRLGVSVESEMGAVEPGPQIVLHGHAHVTGGGSGQ